MRPNKKVYRKQYGLPLFYLLLSCMYSATVNGQFRENKLNFGAKAAINYSLIGAKYDEYSGNAGPSLSMFLSYRLHNSATLFFEPGYSGIEFREQQSENRYHMDCIDLNFMSMIYPSEGSDDFGFILGVRPSFLISHSTESFVNGSTLIMSDPFNKNKNGQLDIGVIGGFSLSLSPIVNLELVYNHSLSNNNTPTNISGRPSTIEFGLRINALGFQMIQNSKQQKTRDLINAYHKGKLLVMLPTPAQSQLNYLKESKREAEIPIIENAYRTNNQIIADEFKNEFSFCPVYFYYDNDAYKVIAGKKDGIYLNRQLAPDTTIQLDTTPFFIASICNDMSNYTQRMQLGLYVYDNNLVQLGKPFNPNTLDFMNEGNPMNYVNGRKSIIYNPVIIRKKIRKLNARLLKYVD